MCRSNVCSVLKVPHIFFTKFFFSTSPKLGIENGLCSFQTRFVCKQALSMRPQKFNALQFSGASDLPPVWMNHCLFGLQKNPTLFSKWLYRLWQCGRRTEKLGGNGKTREKCLREEQKNRSPGCMLEGTLLSAAACNNKLTLHQSFIIRSYFCLYAGEEQIHPLHGAEWGGRRQSVHWQNSKNRR